MMILDGASPSVVAVDGVEAAIVGLGITEVGRVYGRGASRFAADAARLAVADAGLSLDAVDGLLFGNGRSGGITLQLQRELGLRDLTLLSEINCFGASAGVMVQYAALAIQAGLASTVVCAFGDAPLTPDRGAGESYQRRSPSGFASVWAASGVAGANQRYALAARRHMATYGTTSEQLGAVAVAERAWAARNPRAQMTEPITIADHQASRFIVEPLHLLDCCLVSNGGIAVVVTSADRAKDLAQPPVSVWGWGQAHPGLLQERGSRFGLETGAAIAGPNAMKMAGIRPADVDVCELYDCYTYTVLVTLEDYGFCDKGEGGPFVASGALGPGGSLPTNTGGGQLSGYYLWGMTPLSEAVIQARGHGGDRQAPRHDVVLVSGNGGVLDFHSTLILSPDQKN
jgi:acetyl-CoA acetyltransferase